MSIKTIKENASGKTHKIAKLQRVKVVYYGDHAARTAWVDEEGAIWVQMFNAFNKATDVYQAGTITYCHIENAITAKEIK